MTPKEYRISNGMELTESQHHPEKSVFVISDLHLDHENIISYCKRPFRTVRKMNEVLINNWNFTVKPDDIVFFVGDLVCGSPDKFFSKLNGNIRFISGNHDDELDPKADHRQ
jgi:calcineurin-like phosphoesterase family protein